MSCISDTRIANALKVLLLSATSSVAIASASPTALAQSEPITSGLDVITVTAQKREQTTQDVPISVTAVTGEQILDQGFNRLEDLAEFVPNVSIADNFTGSSLFIRGVGSAPGNVGFEQSVATFIDGVYFGRGFQSLVPFMDVERVEVLRGPQPTFFGQNAIGGAMNIATRKPGDVWQSNIFGRFGTENEYSLDVGTGGPLSDTFGLRFSGRLSGFDGWIDNTVPGKDDLPQRDTTAFRIVADWAPSDNTTIEFKAETSQIDQEGFQLGSTLCNNSPFPIPTDPCTTELTDPRLPNAEDQDNLSLSQGGLSFPGSAPIGETTSAGLYNIFVGAVIPVRDMSGFDFFDRNARDVDSSNFLFNLEHEFDGFTLTSTTGFSEYETDFYLDVDASAYALVHNSRGEAYDQFSQEVRLTSTTAGFLDWMVGIYYQDSSIDSYNLTVGAFDYGGGAGPFGIIPIGLSGEEKSTWLSAFAAFTMNFSDSWRVNVGGRYTDVDKDGYVIGGTATTDWTTGTIGAFTPNAAFGERGDSYSDTAFNPSVSVQWDASDTVMFYAKYNQSFKAGGFNIANSVPSAEAFVYEPEEATAWEAGMKGRFFDNTVELNVALFTTEYTDLQVNTFNNLTGSFDVANAATATSEGIEFDGRWLATDNLMLTFAGSLLDATYDDYPGAQCDLSESLSGACPDGQINRAGFDLLYSPAWTFNLGGEYTAPVTSTLDLILSADAFFSDGYETSATYAPTPSQGEYEKINIRAALASDNGWELAAYGRNITDTSTIDLVGPTLLNVGGITTVRSRGESYGVELAVDF